MNTSSEQHTCQNCKTVFSIAPEDFQFYEKIKVPAPTWCPECRMVRRLSFGNERRLFRREDTISKERILSIFPPNAPFPVYREVYWWGDKWNPLQYGIDFDVLKPFLLQLKELLNKVPRFDLINIACVNCHYCPKASYSKNCYFTIGFNAEDCMYGHYTRNVKNSVDYFFLTGSELCYECIYCVGCYNIYFSAYSTHCRDSWFLLDCRDCSNCFGCVGLRHKQYHIFNKPYSKDEYKQLLKELCLDSYKSLANMKTKVENEWLEFPRRFARIYHSDRIIGDNVFGSKQCYFCFDVNPLNLSTENCKYVLTATNLSDSYDVGNIGEGSQLCYESWETWGSKVLFSDLVINSHSVSYSYNCYDSHDLFACVGLRNKQYCILNRQYSKEEYLNLVSRIMNHMDEMPYVDKKGRIYKYGEFFPLELSPFAYNETIAQEYFPLTKEQAIGQGYRWKDPEPRHYTITMTNDQLPDNIKDVPDSITEEIIGCSHEEKCNGQCTQAFKIIPDELKFLRKMNLPLPRLCPNCRHYERLKQRNPLKLWHRKCQCAGKKSEMRNEKLGTGYAYENTIAHFHGDQPCPNEFETSYAPERPEIVYCEACYNQEVV